VGSRPTGRAAHLRGDGGALRRDGLAGAPWQGPRQGQGRGRRLDRAGVDRRPTAQPDLLLPRRAQRAHRRTGRGTQRPADARVRLQPPRALRARRARSPQAATCGAVRLRRVEDRPGQHRLPRRRRAPLLLGAPRAHPRTRGRASGCDDRRDLPSRAARRQPPAQLAAREAHDHADAYAAAPPEAPPQPAIGYISPADFLAGRGPAIWAERDRKLDEACEHRRQLRQQARAA
jgi:hypothetical protein